MQNSGDSHIRVSGVVHYICEMHILGREDVLKIVEPGGASGETDSGDEFLDTRGHVAIVG